MGSVDVVNALYKGDLEKIKKVISDTNDVHIYTINHLIQANDGNEYRMALLPLILKGEKEHPGQFFKYKRVIDYIAQTEGVNYLMYNLKQAGFFRYGPRPLCRLTDLSDQISISPQMKIYFNHLRVRDEQPRRQLSSLLKTIKDQTWNTSSTEKQAVRTVMRHIVRNYRQNHPKSLEHEL